jgi:hypothetical protein
MTVVLDVGALLGIVRGNRRVGVVVKRSLERGERFVVPAGVVAQLGRGRLHQEPLARLLHPTRAEIVPLDTRAARGVGMLLRRSGTQSVVVASVVWCARQRNAVVLTSVPDALRRIDPHVDVEVI